MKARTKKIRAQILRDVIHHPSDVAAHISEIFQITRQAVNRHIKALVSDDWLVASGTTRNKTYKLGPQRKNKCVFRISDDLSEHSVYMKHFSWIFDDLPKNISDIIFYGFTEMFNNAIDHSEGTYIFVSAHRTKEDLKISILDDGEGIFKRIKRLKGLPDERQSIVELAKGKLTTDPANHSGQGIFFTSRMFDQFFIHSHEFSYGHDHNRKHDIMVGDAEIPLDGTSMSMSIATNSKRVDKDVFDEFADNDDFAFNKTIIPVKLARFGGENLVSRSQAKRLLTRIENFKLVLFNFDGVDEIGQAFADEIFRVYRNANPQINIQYINASENVEAWITRAINS